MTTPSGPITLADVQAEFGGPTPIVLSNYYRGGAYVPSGVVDGGYGVPPTSGAIDLGSLRNLTKVTYGFSASLINNLASTGVRSAGFSLNSDGTSSTTRSPSGGTGTATCGNWATPTTTGIGSNHWVKFVTSSSTNTTISGSGLNTIVTASSASWTFQSNATNNEGYGSGTVYIYSDSGGTNQVGTGSVSWDVGYTP